MGNGFCSYGVLLLRGTVGGVKEARFRRGWPGVYPAVTLGKWGGVLLSTNTSKRT